jgi:hypothetical protein
LLYTIQAPTPISENSSLSDVWIFIYLCFLYGVKTMTHLESNKEVGVTSCKNGHKQRTYIGEKTPMLDNKEIEYF